MKIIAMLVSLLALATSAQAASYQDAYEFFGSNPGAQILSTTQYDKALSSLEKQFDYICGDTFCEGDYANLTSLGIECSIDAESQAVGQCIWTLAGSYTELDPATGRYTVQKDVLVCDFGIKGQAKDLATFLKKAGTRGNGYDGLRDATIPGTEKALMDVISDCL